MFRVVAIAAIFSLAVACTVTVGPGDDPPPQRSAQSTDGGVVDALIDLGAGFWDGLWRSFCDTLESFTEAAIRAFCDAYLDRQGFRSGGFRRIAARSICMSRVRSYINWKWMCEPDDAGADTGSGTDTGAGTGTGTGMGMDAGAGTGTGTGTGTSPDAGGD